MKVSKPTLIAKISLYVFFAFLAAMLSMTFLKAYNAGFTHDESFGYQYFTKDSFIDIISLKHAFTKNHPLNTLLMKYSEVVFGNHDWALRLPNRLG